MKLPIYSTAIPLNERYNVYIASYEDYITVVFEDNTKDNFKIDVQCKDRLTFDTLVTMFKLAFRAGSDRALDYAIMKLKTVLN